MAARGTTWREEAKVLLEMWGDEKIQSEQDGAKRKHPFASELHSRGYTRDGEQIKTKLQGQHTEEYNNKSWNEKKTDLFYEELEAILGHRPASTPPDALGGGLSADPEEDRSELGGAP